MARSDAVVLTPGLPECYQFTKIHRDRGRPFGGLPHQLTGANPNRDAPRPSPTGV